MWSSRLAAFLIGPALALALAPAAGAQEEPPLFDEKTAPQATPAPTPEAPKAPPEAPAPPAPPAAPLAPLSAKLDYARWQSMSARERQTFVEGAVSALGIFTARLRAEVGGDNRATPEKMTALVKFLHDNQPRHAVGTYLKEMNTIYLTADGQKLSMPDCFLRALQMLDAK